MLDTGQAILRKVLPDNWFDYLYKLVCGVYGQCVKVVDIIYYLLPSKKVRMIRMIHTYTMVGRKGLLSTYEIASEMDELGLQGCFVECGVARGGCSALLAMIARNSSRDTWLFDSFEGLPEGSVKDIIQNPGEKEDRAKAILAKGYCLGTFSEVEDLLYQKLGLDKDKVHMVKGWFEDTLPVYRENISDITVLILDSDWYESTRCCLENLYDNVIPDGYVIIDDYSLVGCKLAVDEFLQSRKLKINMTLVANGRGYWRK